jgi:hypothetical protein
MDANPRLTHQTLDSGYWTRTFGLLSIGEGPPRHTEIWPGLPAQQRDRSLDTRLEDLR